MNKIPASIMIIGWSKEGAQMYPHLADFLKNIREVYDDVIYIGDGDQGEKLSLIDHCRFPITPFRAYYLMKGIVGYTKLHLQLTNKIRNATFKYKRRLIIAIDHINYHIARKYFPHEVVFWSFDILTKDFPMRVRHGFLENLATSNALSDMKALIIQDEQRAKLFMEATGVVPKRIYYIPVGLNDSVFCNHASRTRIINTLPLTIKIIQSGWIVSDRWSDKLIDSYQSWSTDYKLCLHGLISNSIKKRVSKSPQKPYISETMIDNIALYNLLNDYHIGFVGYAEKDSNHKYIEHASTQLVSYLLLGIPIIACGSEHFNEYVDREHIGVSISHPKDTPLAIQEIVCNYANYSKHARQLFETYFNLTHYTDDVFTLLD